ncbi:MAG: ABC transporter ATP-binding protein [Thermoplasmatota archaeon]
MMEFERVTKDYDGFIALKEVTLKVGSGEVIALVGPNGAGKSTLLRIAAGFLEPTSGDVRMGEAALRPEDARTLVGYLPESATCYEELTARENMEYFSTLRGLSGDERGERVRELLELVGLGGERKLVRQFSKGMRQRLCIAISLIARPELVLWDEPSSGLDPFGRMLLRSIIESLKGRGASVLISSHDLRESALLADRVCLIHRGSVRFLGGTNGPSLEKLYSEVVT